MKMHAVHICRNKKTKKIHHRHVWIVLFLVLSSLVPVPVSSGTDPRFLARDPRPVQIPAEFGTVLHGINGKSSTHLFIIGTGHRDTLTNENGSTTVRSQLEVYRIAEWLSSNRGVELLLPEGFFEKQADRPVTRVSAVHTAKAASFDNHTLEARLSDNKTCVNAEMLLTEYPGMYLRQVEEFAMYDAVRSKLMALYDNGPGSLSALFIQSDLDYLQDRRTAAILQKIPDIIETAYSSGLIRTRQAVLTIGLAHLPWIIRYLKEGRILVHAPAFSKYEDFNQDLNLLAQNFGITVIIPKSLTGNPSLTATGTPRQSY